MPLLRIDRSLGFSLLAFIGVLILFEVTNLDLWVQDLLYVSGEQRWIVDRNAPLPRLLFYTAPKWVIGLVALALIWRIRRSAGPDRRDALVALLSVAAIPALAGIGKATTNVFCPWDVQRYGGTVPYVRTLERFADEDRPSSRGKGFPAGHASGGFALLALAGLARTRRGQLLAIGTGLGMGWTMGLYQMAKGAHYLSHTVVTALFAWSVFLILRRIIGADARSRVKGLAQGAPPPAHKGLPEFADLDAPHLETARHSTHDGR